LKKVPPPGRSTLEAQKGSIKDEFLIYVSAYNSPIKVLQQLLIVALIATDPTEEGRRYEEL